MNSLVNNIFLEYVVNCGQMDPMPATLRASARPKLTREIKVRVDDDLDERIRHEALSEYLDISDIVRRALHLYFKPEPAFTHGKREFLG